MDTERFARLFIIKHSAGFGNPFMGPSNTQSGIVVKIDYDATLSVTQKFGCAPTTDELNTVMGRFIGLYEQKFGPIAEYPRTGWYRFVYKSGISGCQDTFIESATDDGFPDRKKVCHMSMCNKINEGIRCFLFDFLDLCVAAEFMTVKNGAYHYDSDHDQNRDLVTSIYKPRDLDKEGGWVYQRTGLPGIVPIADITREDDMTEEAENEEEKE